MFAQIFPIEVNLSHRNKVARDKKTQRAFNDSFVTIENMTMARLDSALRQGFACCMSPLRKDVRQSRATGELVPVEDARLWRDFKTFRTKANALPTQLLGLDFDTGDERSSFNALLSDDFIFHNASLLQTTRSHTPDKPRAHVFFQLDKPLQPKDTDRALRALLAKYPHADQNINHCACVMYGATNCETILRDILVLEVDELWRAIVEPYEAWQESQREALSAETHDDELRAPMNSGTGATQRVRFAKAALKNRCAEIARLTTGRYTALRAASVRIGTLISEQANADDALTKDDALAELLAAAKACKYVKKTSKQEVERIILTGLSCGANATNTTTLYSVDKLATLHDDFVRIGEEVRVISSNGEILASGTVTHYKAGAGGKLVRVDGIYYPIVLCERVYTDSHSSNSSSRRRANSLSSAAPALEVA